MEYLKIDNYMDKVKSEDKFVINNLIPVGFREIDKNKFIFLFLAIQDFDDKSIYLQLFFSASNQFEYDALKKHPNYIPNYKKDEKLKTVYTNFISHMTKDNLYITDFYLWCDKDHSLYYSTNAVRVINSIETEKLILYLPRNTFIKVKCLLNNYNIRSSLLPTSIMNKLVINEVKFVLVDKIKKMGSIIVEDETYIDTHYAIKAENKIYDINYRTRNDPYKILYNTLKSFSEYENDYYIEYMFPFFEKFFLIYPDGESNKIILVFDKDKVEKETNFINQYNTIFKEEQRNESTEGK